MTQNNDTKTLLEYAGTLEWQPIETAPHNRNIFVKYKNCADKHRIVKACFYEAGTLQAHDDYDGDDVDENGYMTTSKWYEECDNQPDGFIYELSEGTPTHWMPIPTGNAGAVIIELLQCVANVANKAIYHVSEDNIVSDAKCLDWSIDEDEFAKTALTAAVARIRIENKKATTT